MFRITDVPADHDDEPRVTALATQRLGEATIQWLNGTLSFPFGASYLYDGDTFLGSVTTTFDDGEEITVIKLSRRAHKALSRELETVTGLKNQSGIVTLKTK